MAQSEMNDSKWSLPLLIFNSLTLLATLIANYAAGTGLIGEKSVGEVSDLYPTLITPAGYAFSIWGLIYLLLIAFVSYQWYAYYHNNNKDSLLPSGIWFSVSNIANALWIFAWVNEAIGISVLIMAVLLFALIQLVIRLKLEIYDTPLRILAFVWWPICVYIGWIILASVLNVSVYLKSSRFLDALLSEEIWAVIVIQVATIIYIFLIYQRNMREAAAVGVWGLIAIVVNQWGNHNSVVIAAILAIVVLSIYTAYQAIQNWETMPHKKLQKREF